VLEVVDEEEVLPVGEEVGEVVTLAVADLQGEETAGFEGGFGLRDEAAVDIETGRASKEGGGRFVVADLGVELVTVGGGDVRGITDDGVEGLRRGFGGDLEGGEEVGLEELDAIGEVVAVDVGLGDGEGFGREVEGCDVGVGEVSGDGDGDGSGAGADVGEAEREVGVGFEVGEDGLDEVFGFGARDENGRGDLEGEAEELLLAGNVLDGFVAKAAGDGGLIGR
jgi:hypothetical protein